MSDYYREVARELNKCGFSKTHDGKGSHQKWVNQQGEKIIVPFNLVKKGTANGILKKAGSTKKV